MEVIQERRVNEDDYGGGGRGVGGGDKIDAEK